METQKVLRMPEQSHASLNVFNIEAELWRKNAVGIFESHGYRIEYGGEFNSSNPHELGLDMHPPSREKGRTTLVLAQQVGITTPSRFELPAVVNHPGAVVAKDTFQSQGAGKYLLETEEQKLRFIAWAALVDQDFAVIDPRNNADRAREIIDAILKGDIPKALGISGWDFEEYIDTPSPYYTSYRVLADAHGEIHYAQLNRSAQRKGSKRLAKSRGVVTIFEADPRKSLAAQWGLSLEDLLVHRRSPLFLNSLSIMSNIGQGGERILLDGQRIDDSGTRKLLEQHGVNPDKPRASDEILETSSKLGVLNKAVFPYVGVDEISNRELKNYLLEVNDGPVLNPEGLGLDRSATLEDCDDVILERIASYLD